MYESLGCLHLYFCQQFLYFYFIHLFKLKQKRSVKVQTQLSKNNIYFSGYPNKLLNYTSPFKPSP